MSAKKQGLGDAAYRLEEISKALTDLLDSQVEEDKQFEDRFQTSQQKRRDAKISELLDSYVRAYNNKINTQKLYRKVLFWGCSLLIVFFSLGIVYTAFQTLKLLGKVDVSSLLSIITICITLLTSIIGLIQIITKFCFPEDDEKYITTIVESIQKNDLENKKENMHLKDEKRPQV